MLFGLDLLLTKLKLIQNEKIEQILYRCDFCNEDFETPENCKEHENVCLMNPKTKTCNTCKHAIGFTSPWTCFSKKNKIVFEKECTDHDEHETI